MMLYSPQYEKPAIKIMYIKLFEISIVLAQILALPDFSLLIVWNIEGPISSSSKNGIYDEALIRSEL